MELLGTIIMTNGISILHRTMSTCWTLHRIILCRTSKFFVEVATDTNAVFEGAHKMLCSIRIRFYILFSGIRKNRRLFSRYSHFRRSALFLRLWFSCIRSCVKSSFNFLRRCFYGSRKFLSFFTFFLMTLKHRVRIHTWFRYLRKFRVLWFNFWSHSWFLFT